MASPTDNNEGFFSDVRKVGYLRKPKSMHKRFFVLRAASESGPARLEYFENEKKWRHKSGAPKRSIPLESCFNINKRADSKNKHLVALYTKDEHFAIAADSEPEQESCSFRSVTPDSLGHTPPARGDEDLNYICMGGKATSSCCSLAAPNGHFIPRTCHPQQQPRYPSTPCCPRGGSEEVADLEKAFRKRTHSAGTSPTISHQKTPSQSSVASIEEYTEMLPSYPCGSSRLPSYRHSAFVPTHSYPEECLEMHHMDSGHHRTNSAPHTDDGYMPMSPGVAPVPSGGGPPKGGDYMPMSPKSVSAPQQIINPGRGGRHPPATVDSNGYMMMSPSGSYSPDSSSAGYGKIWTNGAGHHPKLSVESNEGKLPCGGSDYINMDEHSA
ncbi:hypothetical protein EK904_004261 [Melospiza melodia maxima]|nr:hypothetical protein EK904_004261 [Melospiza melodia maxima]